MALRLTLACFIGAFFPLVLDIQSKAKYVCQVFFLTGVVALEGKRGQCRRSFSGVCSTGAGDVTSW